MSQNDFSIDNQSGALFRADLNNALQALVSLSSGASAPTTTYAFQLWYDTTNSLLKIRNSANSAWVTLGPWADSTKVESYVGGTKVFDIDSTKATFTLTGAVKVANGTTAQRPTPTAGMLRFNSTTTQFEGYDGTAWGSIGGAGNAKLDVFSGNGSTTAFTLTADPGSKNNTIVTIGGVVQQKSTYSITTTTLTFTTAPPSGTSNIEVMYNVALSVGTPAAGTVNVAAMTADALNDAVASKSANYTATATAANTDRVIKADASSAAFTITTWGHSGNTGRTLTVKKTDSTLNAVTISPASGTIDGKSSIKLCTQNESVTIESDGTNFFIIDKRIVSDFVPYTPTITGFGTPSGVAFWSRRDGDSLEIVGNFTSGTATATAATITMGFAGSNTPSGLTVDGSKIASVQLVGLGCYNAVQSGPLTILASSGNNYVSMGRQDSGAGGLIAQNGSNILTSGQAVSFTAKIPIANWES